MTITERVRALRSAARRAGYRVHYDNVGDVYALHGAEHVYGLTLDEADARVAAATLITERG